MTKLNKAVNTRLQKNLSPEYVYGSQGLQGGFPSRQTLWSRELKVPDVRRDVASAAHVPQRQTAVLRQVPRWADCQRGGAASLGPRDFFPLTAYAVIILKPALVWASLFYLNNSSMAVPCGELAEAAALLFAVAPDRCYCCPCAAMLFLVSSLAGESWSLPVLQSR